VRAAESSNWWVAPKWTENLSSARIQVMKTIGATEFKQKCLALLDRVEPEGIVITKHGKAVAKLVPVAADSALLIGSLSDKIHVQGDLLSTGLRWDAQP